LCIFLDCLFFIFSAGWINNMVLIGITLWTNVKVHVYLKLSNENCVLSWFQ
jgi:hypothetical protein